MICTNCSPSGAAPVELRDHFAGLAMQALLSPNHPWGGYPEKGIPRVAYEMADSMLRAREAGQ